MVQGKSIEVVAGAIRSDEGQILICLRPAHLEHGNLWELPGGKRKEGESRFRALRREVNEELGIEIISAVPLLRFAYRYPTKTIDFDVWEVSKWRGSARGCEGQKIAWVNSSELIHYAFPAANRTVVTALGLPRFACAIPDLRVSPAQYLGSLEKWIDAGPCCVILNNQLVIGGYNKRVLTEIGRFLGRYDAKLIFELSREQDAKGTNAIDVKLLDSIRGHVDCDTLIGFSCSTSTELVQAEQAGAELLLIGPFRSNGFETLNDTFGWSAVQDLVNNTVLPAFTFGSFLEPQDIARAILSGCQGVVLPFEVWTADKETAMDTLGKAVSEIEVADGNF